ncbi:DUF3857 domain-containing protein [Paraflavisolibacter sp. H34]|uniref:DUF3857 domain-containing protein n=1 Tax=Huijunlia imazamoxiresistens TaxID=3127457 RepID=UPI0030166843
MRSLLLTPLILLAGLSLKAQGPAPSGFQWQSIPSLHTVDPRFSSEAAVYVSDEKRIEYALEKDGFFSYKTIHRTIHINNDKGIEYFNKIYLPFDQGLQLMNVKARTVLPSGKVMELDEKNIKDLKDDDGVYKIFALEGLTKGCEVEYYYTLKTPASFFGREIISQNLPVQQARFELITPRHLRFEVKNFNGLPPCMDSVGTAKRHTWLNVEALEATTEEKYAMHTANLKRLEYKLCYNEAGSATERMFTWDQLAKEAFGVYTKASDKELKKIKELLDEAGLAGARGDKEKIVRLESYFKKNFICRDDISGEDASDLLQVIRKKVASEKAFCRLLCVAFTAAGLDYQVVLCGDRSSFEIDSKLENWNNARNFLLYFPSTRKFLAPTEPGYRYPWIPPTWAGTNGLFCEGATLGSFQTAIAVIKPIPMEEYRHSYLNMEIRAKLNAEGEALDMDVKQLYGGYAAPNYKAPFIFAPAGEQDKILKALVKFGTNSENILSHTLENKELDQADPYLPFIISARVKSTGLVERAGAKIIVKVGEFLGNQVQMYDSTERKNRVELGFPHSLFRTIELAIPDGYTVKNAKDLNFNEVFQVADKPVMGFVSSYEQTGNLLKITVREDYTSTVYPLEQYPAFKKIINAAADFNKVVVVLDKQ